MNRNPSNCSDVATNQNADAEPGSVANSRVAWHRPIVTIIDIKRTMLISGSVHDGVAGSL